MNDFTCIILDDEPLAMDILERYLTIFPNIKCVGKFMDQSAAKKIIEADKIDILLLDIEMPGMNGLAFLQDLDYKPITILTTAYRNYAIEGFDLGVIDYVLKPISAVRFEVALHRAIEFIKMSKAKEYLSENEPDNNSTITIKSGSKKISLEIKDITHFQGLKDYVIIYTTSTKHVVLGYMKIIEQKLPTGYFTRVHKSFIVANHKIKLINKNKIEIDQHQIPIGRMYKEKLEGLLSKNHIL